MMHMHDPEFDFTHLRRPCLMGVVNVTPDSFSDGGDYLETPAAVAHGQQLAAAGAQIIDVGAEASSFFRPGVTPVPPAEQLRRLLPVVEGLRHVLGEGVYLSVDTRSAEVARAALAAGAAIINDISAGTHDPALLTTVAQRGAAVILMHIAPTYPANPPADDRNILATVRTCLRRRAAAARAAGIPPQRIALDPGVGFGKTMPDNWRLALACQTLGDTVVLGASRKRFLETPPPGPARPEHAEWQRLRAQLTALADHPRDAASAALTVLAARHGVAIHRVHHVALAARALAL